MSQETVDVIGKVLDQAVAEKDRGRGDLYSGLRKLDPFEIHAVIKAVEQAMRDVPEPRSLPAGRGETAALTPRPKPQVTRPVGPIGAGHDDEAGQPGDFQEKPPNMSGSIPA